MPNECIYFNSETPRSTLGANRSKAAKQQNSQARMKARSLLVSAVAVCALSSGAVPVSAAAVSAVGSSDAASSSSMSVPEVAGDAEATRRVLAQTKEERVSSSPSFGGLLGAFT